MKNPLNNKNKDYIFALRQTGYKYDIRLSNNFDYIIKNALNNNRSYIYINKNNDRIATINLSSIHYRYDLRYIRISCQDKKLKKELKKYLDFNIIQYHIQVQCDNLKKCYNIDKIKPDSIYVWSKDDENGNSENLFVIHSDDVLYYRKHEIVEEAKCHVNEIQKLLRLLEGYYENIN